MNITGITGRLTADCELRIVGDSNVINFSIANDDERRKNQAGEYENVTSFFNITYWSKSGKMANHLKKGKLVSVAGKLKQEQWDKDGKNYSKVVIKATDVLPFIYEKASDGQNNQQQHPSQNGGPSNNNIEFQDFDSQESDPAFN